jgi:GDPmannose 4,6-dehydratase
MTKTALITGILGQDGSYLAELLLSKGYKVHGVVRKESYKNKKKFWRINNIKKNLTLHKNNLNNLKSFYSILEKIKPNEIYHLAAQSYDGHSFNNEFYTFKNNIDTTHFILAAVKEFNNKIKVFFAASSEMYGKIKSYPQNEKTIFNPVSPYGISKLTSYLLVKNYRSNFNFLGCTGILFNHESPRRDTYFVTRKISYGVARIKKGLQKKINLGNMKSSRDWGHAKDFVNAMWLMLQHDKPDDYVIGTGEKHSVLDFANIAFKYVGLDYKDFVNFDKNLKRKVESDNRVADSTKAKKILKWKPKFTFKKLVEDMVESDLRLLKNK